VREFVRSLHLLPTRSLRKPCPSPLRFSTEALPRLVPDFLLPPHADFPPLETRSNFFPFAFLPLAFLFGRFPTASNGGGVRLGGPYSIFSFSSCIFAYSILILAWRICSPIFCFAPFRVVLHPPLPKGVLPFLAVPPFLSSFQIWVFLISPDASYPRLVLSRFKEGPKPRFYEPLFAFSVFQ